MKIDQLQWTVRDGWKDFGATMTSGKADLVLVFGGLTPLEDTSLLDHLRKRYPGSLLFGCSTAGEIFQTDVLDDSLVVTAVKFEGTSLVKAECHCTKPEDSYATGRRLATSLPSDGLRHVLVLSIGHNVNGSELVNGLNSKLSASVTITGGLAGDGCRFRKTLVVCGEKSTSDLVAAVGLYGSRIRVGCGSLGGWDSFGPERLVTRAQANVLYEVDGRSALELYKTYLGEQAKELPASGLLFPLSVRMPDQDSGLVRTILGIDEKTGGMIFAGDIPEGAYARLMKANFDRLVEGATGAAETSARAMRGSSPELALLVSCVGRKMVLGQRIEEEVEAVRNVVGKNTVLTGFYSYGEISPFTPDAKCELHNQTMTVTTFTEE